MYKESLTRYLNDLAARKPAPGGGSAAALVAAAGVSLISMVANFTIGKEKYKSVEEEIKGILSSSEALRVKLQDLVDLDVAAYKKVSTAYGLPKDTSEDKRKRQLAIQAGLREALAAPLEVCKCCHQAAKLCPAAAEKGNLNLISDVGVAILLLESAFQSALLNVEINLNAINDQQFVLEVRDILKPLGLEIAAIKAEVWPQVKQKMNP